MCRIKRYGVGIFLLILIVAVGQAADRTLSQAVIDPSSTILIRGDSNLHDWEVKVTNIDGFVEVALPALDEEPFDGTEMNPYRVELRIPVANLQSGNDIMDGKLSSALKGDRFPVIRFELLEPLALTRQQVEGSAFEILTLNELEVAGVVQPVETIAKVQFQDDGQVLVEGTKRLKMSDFGVEAPSALLGLLVTYDEVEIQFDLNLVSPPGASESVHEAWSRWAGSQLILAD